jgi:8-oxo-dGTP diphosphatase
MRPKVGIGVIVIKNGKVLLGKRRNSHGSGYWSFPGGHLEMFETFNTCAEREVMEETGLTINNMKYVAVTNDIFKDEKKHYITIFIYACYKSGVLNNMEPEKCSEWDWFSWEDLPKPLFLPIENLIKQGFSPEIS